MNRSSQLKLKDINLSVGGFSLVNVNLEIQGGEYFVLLGPTGAGKTVLLEAIAGIKPVTSGTIWLGAEDVTDRPPEARGVGFVYQDFALFPHLSVEKNISFGLLNRSTKAEPRQLARVERSGRTSSQNVRARVEQISSLFRISHLLDRKPEGLSGGEKQRVAMARALITDPQILLLDEPLSTLDPEIRELIQVELRRIHQELGTTTLHITHNFEVAAALADRIGVVMEGKIVQVGPPQEIFRQPVNESLARFVGVRNIFRGHHTIDREGGGHLQLDGLRLASISNLEGAARASIRPEDILLSRKSLVSSARNNFQGRVIQISDRGSFCYVTVRVTIPEQGGRSLDLIALVTQSSVQELGLELDQEIYAAFKASALHVF